MAVAMEDRVPLYPFQEAFTRQCAEGLTGSALARRLGWMRRPSPASRGRRLVGDATKARRYLGLACYRDKDTGLKYVRSWVTRDVALHLATALGLDPVDVGL